MAQLTSQEWGPDKGRRRSLRVLLSVAVTIAGKDAAGKSFQEETKTLVVNAHGALVLLANRIAQGQDLKLTHRTTQKQLPCRAVYSGPSQGGKTQVGIEFTQLSPSFWQINFPPEDWKVPEN